MPVGSPAGSGRYGAPKKKSNVMNPPTPVYLNPPATPRPGGGFGGQQQNILPKDKTVKATLKGVNDVAAPKKNPPVKVNSGDISGSASAATAPPKIVPQSVVQGPQGSGGVSGSASAAAPPPPAPATNIPGSLPTDPVLDRMNGFASRYDPSPAGLGALYDDPNIVLQDVLKSLGFTPGNARMEAMGPYSENMLNLAGLMQMSGSMGGADQADETLINTLAELMSNGVGPGGQSVEYKTALDMLMNPKGAMDEYLFGAAGDPSFGLSQQAAALAPMFQASIQGVNPFTQQAMASAYRSAENSAGRHLAEGQKSDPRILNYLRSRLGGIIPGF